MSWPSLYEVFYQFAYTLSHVLPYLAGMGLLFTVLSYYSPCNAGGPWWHKRGLFTDITYWLIVPVVTRYLRIGVTVLITVQLLGISSTDDIVKFYEHGHGPLSTLPIWSQVIVYLLFSDVSLYWIHRGFHTSNMLWKYHAVHHASKDLDWLSAARFHPVNIILGTMIVDVVALVGGITPDIFLFVGPFNTITSAFVHANLDWTLGWFKYVFAGPVFHRWHHTREGCNKNFASTFPFLDVMFGTFYMPEGVLPQAYGIDDDEMPEDFARQLVYPLLQKG